MSTPLDDPLEWAQWAPNQTVARCQEQLNEAKQRLECFGGESVLGYALSHSLFMDGDRGALAFADAIRRYVEARQQVAEAWRIVRWNAEQQRRERTSETEDAA